MGCDRSGRETPATWKQKFASVCPAPQEHVQRDPLAVGQHGMWIGVPSPL